MTKFSQLITLILFSSLLASSWTLAQDTIILKNGTEISAKVLEVSPGLIKYRRQDNPDGPMYSTGTSDILLIRYANGTKDILNAGALPNGSSTPISPILPSNTLNSAPVSKLQYRHGLFSRYFTSETGERLSRSFVRIALANQPDALETYRQGQSLRNWSRITGGTALALLSASAIVISAGDEGGGNGHRSGTNDNIGTNGFERRRDHGSTEVGLALAGGGVLLGVTSLYLGHRTSVQFRRAADRYNSRRSTSLHVGPSSRTLGLDVALTF